MVISGQDSCWGLSRFRRASSKGVFLKSRRVADVPFGPSVPTISPRFQSRWRQSPPTSLVIVPGTLSSSLSTRSYNAVGWCPPHSCDPLSVQVRPPRSSSSPTPWAYRPSPYPGGVGSWLHLTLMVGGGGVGHFPPTRTLFHASNIFVPSPMAAIPR